MLQGLQDQVEAKAGGGKFAHYQFMFPNQKDRTATPSARGEDDHSVSPYPRIDSVTPQDAPQDLSSSHEYSKSQTQPTSPKAPDIADESHSGSKKRRQWYGQVLESAGKSPRLDSVQQSSNCQTERSTTLLPSESFHHHIVPKDRPQGQNSSTDMAFSDVQTVRYPDLTESVRNEYLSRPGLPIIDLEEVHNFPSPAPEYISLDSSEPEDLSEDSFPTRPAPPLPATEPELCEEQSNLVNLILSGANVFYTGSAGCGKSTVLKAFVKRLKDRGKTVNIIAPTGKSALDVEGTTIWTYAGWYPDIMKLPIEKLEIKAQYQPFVNARLCETDVLVIDEVSMLENNHFERLNRIMKSARSKKWKFPPATAAENARKPFGGVQVIVTGDFCKLPPVEPFKYCSDCGYTLEDRDIGVYACPKHGDFLDIDKWTFRSKAWKECDFRHVNLTQIHRQRDHRFITILNKLRFGHPLSIDDRSLLLDHPCETTNAVRLFPLVREVREINSKEFSKLEGPTLTFDCVDGYDWRTEHQSLGGNWECNKADGTLKALNNHRFERQLQFRPQMLVVLLVNLDIKLGLVNGSQGIVLGFVPIDPSQIPEQNGHHGDLKKRQIEEFIKPPSVKEWPLVRFHNGVTRPIKAQCVVNELGESSPYSLMYRTQIPLLAAWAMTIHKSQGMTLSRVDVNISKAFEKGQGYVALSRATSLEGLNVRALGDCDQGGNEQVMEFLVEKFGNGVIGKPSDDDSEVSE